VSSILFAAIYLSDSASSSGLPLVNSSVSGQNDFVVNIHVGSEMLNVLKSRGFYLSQNRSFICFDSFVRDMFGNAISPLACTHALQVSGYQADAIQPDITAFDFNWSSSAKVTIRLDEPIAASSINVSVLAFFSALTNTSVAVGPADVTNFSVANDALGSLIGLSISETLADSFALAGVCLSPQSCAVLIGDDFVADMSGNILPAQLVAVDNFVADSTAPSLINVEVDMDSGYVTLIFSEPVDAANFAVSGVQLQAAP